MIERHSLEMRILEHLQMHYPVTARQLAGALHLSEKRILVELRRMETKGMVELDVLPDDVFVRCLVVIRQKAGEGGGERGERGLRMKGKTMGQGEDGRGKDGMRKGTKEERKGGDDPAYI